MIDFQARPRLAAIPALCIAVSLTFGTAGCSNIQDDGTRTKTEGTLVGGGIGAAFGALLGGLIGGDGKGALIGAGIGAGVGSLAGFFVGKHVADKKAERAVYECLAPVFEMEAEEVENMPPSELISMLKQMAEENDLPSFFGSVFGTLGNS